MKKITGIYKIENLKNHKVYIGQSNNVKRRFIAHKNLLEKNKHQNFYLQSAWNKYGKNAFSFEIIEECVDRSELNQRETYWFNYYCELLGKTNVYNLGHTGNAHNTSDELRKKQSEYRKTHPNNGTFKKGTVFSKEFREKLSLASPRRKKVAQYNAYGKLIKVYNSLMDAEKETGVLSQNIGRCCRNGAIKSGNYIWRYVENNNVGDICVNENITNIVLGKVHGNYGKKASEETRKKISKSHIGKSPLIKKVDQLDLEGNFIKTWNSFTEIKNFFGKSVAHVISCCTGSRKTSFGYKWRYHNNESDTSC